jgi:hypothetical protein
MRRTRTLLVAATGSALSLLLGSGLLALISDSVTSQGNALTSGTYTGAYDVKAALLADTTPAQLCNSSTVLSDGPLAAHISQPIGLIGAGATATNDICIRNDGPHMGRVRVSITNVVDTETGDAATPGCVPTESGAGDTTCEGGAAGELSPILRAVFPASPDGFSSTSCATRVDLTPFPGSAIVDTDLAPGETCRVFLGAAVPNTVTDTERLVAQTDRVQFDIVATLEDITVP